MDGRKYLEKMWIPKQVRNDKYWVNNLSFLRGGVYWYVNGNLDSRGSGGYYWESTINSTISIRFLYFSLALLYPQYVFIGGHGFSIRCVVKP